MMCACGHIGANIIRLTCFIAGRRCCAFLILTTSNTCREKIYKQEGEEGEGYADYTAQVYLLLEKDR